MTWGLPLHEVAVWAEEEAPETQSVPVFSSEWRESAPGGGSEQKARYLPAASSSSFYPVPLQKPDVLRQPEESP